ncbi:reverse transcriptase domain-containing protein [Tanacetum coccineum]
MVPATTPLLGFSGEISWPLGQISQMVSLGDGKHSTSALMNFMVVRSLSPYNGIIGRLGVRKIQAVPSTAHEMLKFPVEEGILTNCSNTIILAECRMSRVWDPLFRELSLSVLVLVAPEVGAAAVASPARVLELDTHSLSKANPSKSSPPPVSVAPMVSPFLSRVALRSSSPTTSTLEIPTAPILPAPSAIVAPSSEFPLAPVVAPPRIRQRRAILIRPGEDIPIGRLYRTHPGGPCRALTARKSVRPLPSHRLALRYTSHHLDHFTFGSSSSHSSSDHSSSGHSITGHSLSGHTPPDTTDADSSTPPRFVHPPLARTPRCSEAYLRWRSAPLSTMYPPTTSESSARDSSSESSAGPSRKRCRSHVATVTLSIHATRALVPYRANLLLPRKRFKDFISPEDSIGMEVDVGVDVEDKVKDEVESSDRGTMEVGVDVVFGIDIPDAMLMPDAVERLEQVEEGFQDIYDHVIEIPLQRIEDIETGQRELESRSLIAGGERASLLEQVVSLERSNARLRGTMMMERARADRFWRRNMTITHSGMTPEAIEELVNRRVEEALAAYEATRTANALEAENQSQNGSDGDNGNGNSRDGNGGDRNGGNGNPNENNRDARHVVRECTYQDFMKCQPLNFKGTEGVVVEEALTAYEATRAANALEAKSQSQNSSDDDNGNGGNGNGGDGNGGNGNGGNGNPNENIRDVRHVVRECTYQDFMKCQPLNFKGTKGVVGLIRWFEKMETVSHISNCLEKYQVKYATCTLLNSALTWWNSHKRTVRTDDAFAMSWRELMKLMAEVYCPRNEIQKMESELWNLTVKNNDLVAYT